MQPYPNAQSLGIFGILVSQQGMLEPWCQCRNGERQKYDSNHLPQRVLGYYHFCILFSLTHSFTPTNQTHSLTSIRLVVHLTEAAYPVTPHAVGHLAKDHGLVLVAEHVLRDPDLQVEVLVGKVTEKYIQCLLAPPRSGPRFKHVNKLFEDRAVGDEVRVNVGQGARPRRGARNSKRKDRRIQSGDR